MAIEEDFELGEIALILIFAAVILYMLGSGLSSLKDGITKAFHWFDCATTPKQPDCTTVPGTGKTAGELRKEGMTDSQIDVQMQTGLSNPCNYGTAAQCSPYSGPF
jgi:hypothetical protein